MSLNIPYVTRHAHSIQHLVHASKTWDISYLQIFDIQPTSLSVQSQDNPGQISKHISPPEICNICSLSKRSSRICIYLKGPPGPLPAPWSRTSSVPRCVRCHLDTLPDIALFSECMLLRVLHSSCCKFFLIDSVCERSVRISLQEVAGADICAHKNEETGVHLPSLVNGCCLCCPL